MRKRSYIKYLLFLILVQQCFYLPAQNLTIIDSIRNRVKSSPDDTSKVSALINLSQAYRNSNSDSAFKYGLQAVTLSIHLKSLTKIGYAQLNLGSIYLDKGDYGSASDLYLKALKIHEDLKDNAGIARCYNNIGIIYYYQKNYNVAMDYFSKALKINKEFNYTSEIYKNYIHIGVIYNKWGKFEEAVQSYLRALKIQEGIGNKKNLAEIYTNMCMPYYNMGKINLALESSEKAVKFAEEIGNKRVLPVAYSNLADLYIEAKKYDKANFALQRALKYSKETKDKGNIMLSYHNFATLFELQNNFKKALEYARMANVLTDSINNESNSRQTNELTAKYESEKKELMISSLEKDKALSEEKLVRDKNFKTYLIIFCLFIIAFAFGLFRGNVQKRKANLALSFAYQEIEEKNKDITDSINYSKRIQEASLSPKELKYKLFPDAFVLFKPKDIISGDFYWYTEKNEKKLIAACDCTGHGVPGALMSMLGNNILNQIVNEKGITSPDEILNHLNNEVRKALKQEGHGKTQDGMDIALISITGETEIEYAGAQRPLWVIKNDEKSLLELKSEKFSIGGQQSETERKFIKQTISLSKGDCIYLSSDGFADQFGGLEGKRFMSKRFKDLLLTNSSKPMPEQENILVETINKWKGKHEQVDDILVIGIRV